MGKLEGIATMSCYDELHGFRHSGFGEEEGLMRGPSYCPLTGDRREVCITFDHLKAETQAGQNRRHKVWAGANFGFVWGQRSVA